MRRCAPRSASAGSAGRAGSPSPHRRQCWAHPRHIGGRTGLARPRSARDWACAGHVATTCAGGELETIPEGRPCRCALPLRPLAPPAALQRRSYGRPLPRPSSPSARVSLGAAHVDLARPLAEAKRRPQPSGKASRALLLGSPWRAALRTQERDGKQRSHLAMLRYIHDVAKLTKVWLRTLACRGSKRRRLRIGGPVPVPPVAGLVVWLFGCLLICLWW